MFDTRRCSRSLEKIRGRIAVSAAARKVIVEHLGGDAVVIPNGVDGRRTTRGAEPLPGYPRDGAARSASSAASTSRARGWRCCSTALARLAGERPELRLLVAGRGDADDFLDDLPPALAARVDLLGMVSEADKARLLRSVDVYVRAQHRRRRASASSCSRRWRPAPRSWPATSTRSAGCSTAAAAGELFRHRRPAAAGARAGRVLDDPAAPAAAGRAGGDVRGRRYDWAGRAPADRAGVRDGDAGRRRRSGSPERVRDSRPRRLMSRG